ncbi:MAG TPA: F0F1 ATP synthase subunit A [Spirochaetota bacterium]|nr:F0F1 ATP synthase subunit A [Spirochaetota bacterium]OPZ36517.1 MAG: ATP synthase subunit a [Spirochaetes bacterium ADurb.BinA120]HPM07879.1 F0F1 ATP synthase subunit A [Bacilli bacterium]HNU90604.1 F0F1 ATP synthase subunit A [Spirochaetota bacterium]HPI14660.1 F0F1 ATP synthase subunit A [Spirochaetota bacterium]
MIHLLHSINSFITSGGGEDESMFDIVMHHLTDHTITTGFIGKINEQYLGAKLFGIFDMRITRWVIMLWVAAIICLIVFVPIARKIKNAKYGSSSKWVNLWEVLISFVHDEIVEPNFDHHYVKKAMPYFLSVFFFVLFCNLAGLIPGMSTATGNLAVTAGLAILTLLGMIGVGMVKQGPLGYWAGLVPHGVPAFVIPLMFPIEIIGLFIKPFALTVRLFANMTAGHVVIIIFLYLVMMFQSYWVGIGSVTGSLMIYLLELLVAFIQAYIFAALSAMFIGSSMHAH